MARHIFINKKISPYTRTIQVSSDKSLSIRTVLLASQAVGISKISNLLESEDVLNTLKVIKKLGIKYIKKKKIYEIYGFGLNGFSPKNNTVINAGNSGTLGRLILSLLIKNEKKIKLIGDKSLAKRDFTRNTKPIPEFDWIHHFPHPDFGQLAVSLERSFPCQISRGTSQPTG